ncbi:unnamed protein product [Blumeria hordei]|uniref:RRM domain-containing protein n=1 Tax=Blumeria hordei TaxID=2867405 RepID=A0A383V2J3_BLUHO|nr:unnamed protein product [Blumeria hordei]
MSSNSSSPHQQKKERSSKKRAFNNQLNPEVAVAPNVDSSDSEVSQGEEEEELKPECKLGSSTNEPLENRPSKKRKTEASKIEVDINAPNPPSKKELRRLKKGKKIPASKTVPTDEIKVTKTEAEKRSEHGIWIGNLPFHVSPEDLNKFLVDNSEIKKEMITRIHMPRPHDDKSLKAEGTQKVGKTVLNKGFAYVDFSSAEAVTEALLLTEKLLNGRRVLIKDHKSFEGRITVKKPDIRSDGKAPSKRVFVGNLSFDTTEDNLKEHFEKCGPTTSIKVATFEDSGKCKGYAWIVFDKIESAESAVRGFIHREDTQSDSELDSEDENQPKGTNSNKPIKKKLRKVWVNRINGRSLRMEFAEDAQVRYKKRYGKKLEVKEIPWPSQETTQHESAIVAKTIEYRQPYAPRLTGGIVESKGKKITF